MPRKSIVDRQAGSCSRNTGPRPDRQPSRTRRDREICGDRTVSYCWPPVRINPCGLKSNAAERVDLEVAHELPLQISPFIKIKWNERHRSEKRLLAHRQLF